MVGIGHYHYRCYWCYEKSMRIFSRLSCREGDGDKDLILCNRDVCQVWRLNSEVRHVHGTGRRSRYRLAHYLSLHIKYLLVGFAVHRQVASQLKMNRLPISIAVW